MEDTLGGRLRRLRMERGWSTYEAAKRAGMTHWGLSQLERKGSLGNVQAATLRTLARLYDVTVDYLVREAEDQRTP